MKLAITSIDGTMEGMIDDRFGRAKKIVIYDTETKNTTIADNTVNLNAAQGAGIQSAQNILNEGIGAVISGHLGPNAFRVLNGAGVKIFTASGMTISDAIRSYEQGNLKELTGADVQGHW